MIISAIIFGMTLSEFLTTLGFAGALIAGYVTIRTTLVRIEVEMKKNIAEINLKMMELEQRINRQEETLTETSQYFRDETDKINTKIEDKIDKIDRKIDHMIDAINQIKVTCAGRAIIRKQIKKDLPD